MGLSELKLHFSYTVLFVYPIFLFPRFLICCSRVSSGVLFILFCHFHSLPRHGPSPFTHMYFPILSYFLSFLSHGDFFHPYCLSLHSHPFSFHSHIIFFTHVISFLSLSFFSEFFSLLSPVLFFLLILGSLHMI